MTDFARLVLDADTRGLKQGERDLQGIQRQSAKTAQEVDAGASRMGSAFKKVGVALVAAGIGNVLFDFGKRSVQAAIDAEEMGSAFNVVFGAMADDVRKWAEETGNALGRSTQEIQRGALAFQELFGKALDPAQAAEMSKQFAVLTQDLASFKNLSNEVAQQKLFSGLVGEAEPLRAVGVFLNEAAVQAKAAELGLAGVNGVLTDQEKIVARAAVIQEQLALASGDVVRTSDSAANQIKTMNAAVEELQVAIGQKLLPQLTPLITLTAEVITMMANAASQINVTTQSTANFVEGLRVLGGWLKAGADAVRSFGNWLGWADEQMTRAANRALQAAGPIAQVVGLIERLGAAQNRQQRLNDLGVGEGPANLGMLNASSELAAMGIGKLNAPAALPKLATNFGSVGAAAKSAGGALSGAGVAARAANDDFGDLYEAIFPGSITRRQKEQLRLIDEYKAKLEELGISQFTARTRILTGGDDATVSDGLLRQGPLTEAGVKIEEYVEKVKEARIKTGRETQGIAESFGQMADRTLQALDRMTGAIRGGGFLDILSSVINLGIQLGGMGAFGRTVQERINRPPPQPGRANGGLASAGQSYLVGERGPELFTPGATGFVTPRAGNDNTRISVEASPYFDVRVDGQIVQAAPAMMQGGAKVAQAQSARAQSRRVPG